VIGGGETAAFFDIQKNYCAFGKAFFFGVGDGVGSVLRGFLCRLR
jgi:hypothetical protein